MPCSLSIAAGHRPALRSISAPAIGAHLLVRTLKRLKSRAPAVITRVRHYIVGRLSESFRLRGVTGDGALRGRNRVAVGKHLRAVTQGSSVGRGRATSQPWALGRNPVGIREGRLRGQGGDRGQRAAGRNQRSERQKGGADGNTGIGRMRPMGQTLAGGGLRRAAGDWGAPFGWGGGAE